MGGLLGLAPGAGVFIDINYSPCKDPLSTYQGLRGVHGVLGNGILNIIGRLND